MICFRKRQNELDGEIFEIIATFSDFIAFKNMFLDYKNVSFGLFYFYYLYLLLFFFIDERGKSG